jgi:hypothetical protein
MARTHLEWDFSRLSLVHLIPYSIRPDSQPELLIGQGILHEVLGISRDVED